MKKLIMRLVLVLTVLVGVGAGTPALANTVGGTDGHTSTSVKITANPNATRLDLSGGGSGAGADSGSDTIPDGKKPASKTKLADQAGDNTANKNKKASPAAAVATVVRSGSADLIAGRLPQTSGSRMFLTTIFGLLLLIVLILSVTVYRQARLLRERE